MNQLLRSSSTARGIMINGPSGAGKTTLAREVARRLGFPHLDLDDYYFPQDASNPFAELRPRDEIIEHLKRDLSKHPHFVMSGTIGSILWDFANPLFNFAVLLSVPTEVRLVRVKMRAYERFGERVLLGGDLHESHLEFYERISEYDVGYHSVSLERHEKWAAELDCPVLRTDGTKSISENAAWIADQYLSITPRE